MRPCFKAMLLLSAVLIPLDCFSGPEPEMTLSIGGDVKKPRQWSVEQLKAQFSDQIREVKFMDPLRSYKFVTGKGIPLYSFIKAAEPWKEKKTKWTGRDRGDAVTHSHMVFLVILEARDSFHTVFSLAELMPHFRSTEVLLVWEKDGEPLSGEDAPLRLAVVNDRDPDRNMYGISSITLLDCEKLMEQLKAK